MRTTLLGVLLIVVGTSSCSHTNVRISSPSIELALLQDAVEPAAPAPPADPPASTSPGGLKKSEIAAVYAPVMKDIKACYERGLARNVDLAGTVKTRSVIKSDGSVHSAEVESSTLADAEVEGCILGVIKGLRFPKPVGGGQVLVVYPFVFSSTAPEPAPKSRGACGFP